MTEIFQDPAGPLAQEAAADVRKLVLSRMEASAVDMLGLFATELDVVVSKAFEGIDPGLLGDRPEYLAAVFSSFAVVADGLGVYAAIADPETAQPSKQEAWDFMRRFVQVLENQRTTF